MEQLLAGDRHRLSRVIGNPEVKPTANGRYRHWDALRHLTPPGDLTHEEWWLGIKLARRQIAQPIPLLDTHGEPFTIGLPAG
jgi:hypothetical protein